MFLKRKNIIFSILILLHYSLYGSTHVVLQEPYAGLQTIGMDMVLKGGRQVGFEFFPFFETPHSYKFEIYYAFHNIFYSFTPFFIKNISFINDISFPTPLMCYRVHRMIFEGCIERTEYMDHLKLKTDNVIFSTINYLSWFGTLYGVFHALQKGDTLSNECKSNAIPSSLHIRFPGLFFFNGFTLTGVITSAVYCPISIILLPKRTQSFLDQWMTGIVDLKQKLLIIALILGYINIKRNKAYQHLFSHKVIILLGGVHAYCLSKAPAVKKSISNKLIEEMNAQRYTPDPDRFRNGNYTFTEHLYAPSYLACMHTVPLTVMGVALLLCKE